MSPGTQEEVRPNCSGGCRCQERPENIRSFCFPGPDGSMSAVVDVLSDDCRRRVLALPGVRGRPSTWARVRTGSQRAFPTRTAGLGTRQWLGHHHGWSSPTASCQIHVARKCRRELPLLADALRDGVPSFEHVMFLAYRTNDRTREFAIGLQPVFIVLVEARRFEEQAQLVDELLAPAAPTARSSSADTPRHTPTSNSPQVASTRTGRAHSSASALEQFSWTDAVRSLLPPASR